MDVRGAADALSGVENRAQERLSPGADNTLDADLDHSVARDVEACHLEVDERERRSFDRQVPRGPWRWRAHHAQSLPPRNDADPRKPPAAMTSSEPVVCARLGTSPKTGTARTRMMATLENPMTLTRAALSSA